MSKKSLIRGFAHNAAQQYAVSAVHVAYLAREMGAMTIELDLYTCAHVPRELDIERNITLAQSVSTTLHNTVARLTKYRLVTAVLRVEYDFTSAGYNRIAQAVYTVDLQLDDGSTISGTHTERPQILSQ
ncbi:MAG: hypothetical protein HY962_09130 [Ignavibacteriae bacterium]|nr:hypothetical protein [Ignavibacteriota bacterium]